MEKRLFESSLTEQDLKELICQLPIGIFSHSPGLNGKILYANKSMACFLGIEEPDALYGIPVAKILKDPIEWNEVIQDGARTNEPQEKEVRFRHKGGGSIWGAVQLRVVCNQKGQIVRVDTIVRDITRQVKQRLSQKTHEDVRQAYYRVIENLKGRLQRLSRRLLVTQEQERKRLAMELHDGIGQTLSAVKMVLEHQKLRCKHCQQLSNRSLHEAIQMLIGLSGDLHNIIFDLRPPLLDDLGLEATIQWYLEQFAKRYPIEWNLDFAIQEEDLPPEYPIIIYRIVQEAVTNVGRHSRATNVWISLGKRAGKIVLVIEDDGIGFDPAQLESNIRMTYGLTSMYQRAELVGGSCSYHSQPGKGTRIEVEFPRVPIHPEAIFLRA